MSYRIEKFSSTLRNVLSLIFLNDLDDPELKFLSISNIDVSKDLKSVKIFVSSPDTSPGKLIEKLENAKGYIKKELARNMRLKYIPMISFQFDNSFEFNQKVSVELK